MRRSVSPQAFFPFIKISYSRCTIIGGREKSAGVRKSGVIPVAVPPSSSHKGDGSSGGGEKRMLRKARAPDDDESSSGEEDNQGERWSHDV